MTDLPHSLENGDYHCCLVCAQRKIRDLEWENRRLKGQLALITKTIIDEIVPPIISYLEIEENGGRKRAKTDVNSENIQ